MLVVAEFADCRRGGLKGRGKRTAQEGADSEVMATVYGKGPSPEEITKGPKCEGSISARRDGRMQVTTADGNNTAIAIADYTKIKSSGGFLGLDRDKLTACSLLIGLPVEVDTLQWKGGTVENAVNLQKIGRQSCRERVCQYV